jgi:hypothetical protein
MAAPSELIEAPEPELTATQYVILAEAQRKKRALAETRIKYNVLVEENKRLLEEREHTEKVTYEVSVTVLGEDGSVRNKWRIRTATWMRATRLILQRYQTIYM